MIIQKTLKNVLIVHVRSSDGKETISTTCNIQEIKYEVEKYDITDMEWETAKLANLKVQIWKNVQIKIFKIDSFRQDFHNTVDFLLS